MGYGSAGSWPEGDSQHYLSRPLTSSTYISEVHASTFLQYKY